MYVSGLHVEFDQLEHEATPRIIRVAMWEPFFYFFRVSGFKLCENIPCDLLFLSANLPLPCHFGRVKRGRGVVGSRMDEPGPYCASKLALGSESRLKEDWEDRIARPVAGPSQRPKSVAHAESDSGRERQKHRKGKKSSKGDSSDRISADNEEKKQRQRSKEKRRKDKKKVRESETGKKRKRH